MSNVEKIKFVNTGQVTLCLNVMFYVILYSKVRFD